MYTIILSVLFGVALSLGLLLSKVSSLPWSIPIGLLGTVAVYGLLALRFRSVLNAKMKQIQTITEGGQKQLQAKINHYQTRPVGSPQQVMADIEKMQRAIIMQTLDATSILVRYVHWIPLMERQIATMRLQLHYQLKNFDEVDRLLPKCIMLDPTTLAMKLAQMYRRKAPLDEQRAVFNKAVSRARYNQSALLYALMAWIYVQEKRNDEAHKVLVESLKKNEHETLRKNCDRLANNKYREFSNAGLGELWYALLLEAPKMQTRRQSPQAYGKRPF